MYKYPNSIDEAAKLLDEAMPNWSDKIDLNKLDMKDGHLCILGQLYNHYDDGLKKLFGLDTTNIDNLNDPYISDDVFGDSASVQNWRKQINSRKQEVFIIEGLGVNRMYGRAMFVQIETNQYKLISIKSESIGNRCNCDIYTNESGKATLAELQKFDSSITEAFPVSITRKS